MRIPCPEHGGHDMDTDKAARVVATLTAALHDEQTNPAGIGADPWCPLDVLASSRDIEGYLEYTESALWAMRNGGRR